MNEALTPLSRGSLEALVSDEPSPPATWMPSPLRQTPSPALASLPNSPAEFPSPPVPNSPVPHFHEDIIRSPYELSNYDHGRHPHVSPARHPHPHSPGSNAPGPCPTTAPVPPLSQDPAGGLSSHPPHPLPNGSTAMPAPQASDEPTKACGLCQERLPIAEFRVNQRNTYGTYCLDCNALRSRHKTLRVAQLREMLAAGQISKSDVHAAVAAANPDYVLPGDASLPATRECLVCDFPKPITKFPAFGEAFAAVDPPPALGQPKRGLCCQKCDAALRKAFHVPMQDLRSAASAGSLADFMAIAVPRNPNLSRLAEVISCGICDAPRPIPDVKDIPADAADIAAIAQSREHAGGEAAGVAAAGVERDGGAVAAAAAGFVRACVGCRRALRMWHGSLLELRTAISDGALAVTHANPNNIPKAYRYARVPPPPPLPRCTSLEA